MTATLPAVAALTVGGVTVATRRSKVLHVATPGAAGLTPTGRLRRGHAPLCGQHARRWTAATVDGRRLCTRCATRTTTLPATPAPDRTVTAELIADSLRTATDLDTVHAAVMALCTAGPGVMTTAVAGPDGYPVHVTRLVSIARARLTQPRWAA